MHTFYVYAGEAGRKVLGMQIKCYLSNSWDYRVLADCMRLLAIDQTFVEKGQILPSGFKEKYLEGQGTKNLKGKKIDDLLSTYLLSAEDASRGVGKIWPKGEKIAQVSFAAINDRFQGDFESTDHFHISHSGGGGIGSGSGPVFSEGFRNLKSKSKSKTDLRAITSSIFLPRTHESKLVIPNTCSTIGLHSQWCDGIFIYDTNIPKKWEKYNGIETFKEADHPERAKDPYWIVDYAAAEVQLMLSGLNEKTLKCTGTNKVEKDFEGADLITLTRDPIENDTCGLIVPCYAEYNVKLLKDLSIRVLIKDLLTRRNLASYSLEKPIDRIGLFIIYPSNEFDPSEEKRIEKQTEGYIKELIPSTNEEMRLVYSSAKLIDRVKIMALLINPWVDRLFEMRNMCLVQLIRMGDKLMTRDTGRTSNYKKIIDELEDHHQKSLKYHETQNHSKVDDSNSESIMKQKSTSKIPESFNIYSRYVNAFLTYDNYLETIYKK